MRQKAQKGFSLIGILMVVVIILIIAAIMTLILGYHRHSGSFKESFSVEIIKYQLNDEKRQIIQPLVTKRLQELRDNLQTVQKEKADLFMLPETTNPEEATQRINKLNEIEAKITSASSALTKAENSAEYFRFKI